MCSQCFISIANSEKTTLDRKDVFLTELNFRDGGVVPHGSVASLLIQRDLGISWLAQGEQCVCLTTTDKRKGGRRKDG